MVTVPSLDRTDRAIAQLLQENARLSNKEIAATVGVAQSTCSERIRRLENSGVFKGFHADVDPGVLGVGLQAMIAVRLHRHETTQVERSCEVHDSAVFDIESAKAIVADHRVGSRGDGEGRRIALPVVALDNRLPVPARRPVVDPKRAGRVDGRSAGDLEQ